jgi:hypothetical protein
MGEVVKPDNVDFLPQNQTLLGGTYTNFRQMQSKLHTPSKDIVEQSHSANGSNIKNQAESLL